MYVDQLRKREEVLLGGGDKAPPSLPAEESRDAVMEGAVAITVFDFAAEKACLRLSFNYCGCSQSINESHFMRWSLGHLVK